MRFELISQDPAGARLGRLHTSRGVVETPAFMPVGTNATVKAMTPEEVAETGAQMILANAFHLYLRPGAEVIDRAGGLHAFMGWSGPILTDSGGYQVLSLAKIRTLDEDGVTFRSPVDGSLHRFTPEGVIDFQRVLGSDVVMPLDVLLGFGGPLPGVTASPETGWHWSSSMHYCRVAYHQCPPPGRNGSTDGAHPGALQTPCTALNSRPENSSK